MFFVIDINFIKNVLYNVFNIIWLNIYLKKDFLIFIEKDFLEEFLVLTEFLKFMLIEFNNKDLLFIKVFDFRVGLIIDDSMIKKYDEKLD